MAQLTPKKTLEEHREERRRARWSAFWTPFITLASIVISVGLLMFFARACRERFPQFSPPGTVAPLKNQPASGAAVQDSSPTSSGKGAVTQESQGTKVIKTESRVPAR